MKTNGLMRTLASLFVVVAVTLYFSTPSKAFFFHHHHHHHHHFKHVKTVKLSPASQPSTFKTPFLANYIAIGGICATASLGLQAAMAGAQGLNIGQAHGAVAGCFLPILGQWLLVDHYKRLCVLSRTNPSMRDYRIYCAA